MERSAATYVPLSVRHTPPASKQTVGGGDPAGGGSDYSRYLAEWSEGVPQCVSFDLGAEVTDEYVKMLCKDKGNTLIFAVLRHFLYDIHVP